MAYAAAGLAAVAILAQTFRQTQEAQAQADALGAQASYAVGKAELEAASVKESAAFEEAQARRRSRMIIGKQVATTAAGGVDIASGSPLLMELDSIRQAEMEAQAIRRSGANVALSRTFAGQAESALSKFQARAIRRSIPWMILGGVAGAGAGGYGAYRLYGGGSSGVPGAAV